MQELLAGVAAQYVEDESRACRHTLRDALLTPLEGLSRAQRELVDFLLL